VARSRDRAGGPARVRRGDQQHLDRHAGRSGRAARLAHR
jgi:hypothetical protein